MHWRVEQDSGHINLRFNPAVDLRTGLACGTSKHCIALGLHSLHKFHLLHQTTTTDGFI